MINGVDISVIQGKVDFVALAASGIQFVIIRCGVGNGGIDSLYASNVAAAKAAGLKVMAYHFVYPLPPLASQPLRDPVKQAQYHFKAAQGELAACDYEWPTPDQWAKWGCTASQMNQWCLAYLQEYERLSGQKMAVYTYPYFAQSLNLPADFAQYPLWIASYETNPTIPHPWTDWVLWQTTGGGGHLPVSDAAVDTDVAKDLSLWDAVPVPAPIVIPAHQPDPTPVPLPPPPPVVAPAPLPVPPVVSNNMGILVSIWNAVSNFFKK